MKAFQGLLWALGIEAFTLAMIAMFFIGPRATGVVVAALAAVAVATGSLGYIRRRRRRRATWSPFDAEGHLRDDLFTTQGFTYLGYLGAIPDDGNNVCIRRAVWPRDAGAPE